MANPRIQHKRGPNAPDGNSGITAGEFAIQLGTGPLGPVNVFVGVSGSNTPVRVGTTVVENFSITSNNSIPTSQAVANYVGLQFAQQSLGVCFMEGPVPGQGTIDIQQSLGNSNSGFSGLVGVTFSIAFTKTVGPSNSNTTDDNGIAINHRILLGDSNDGLAPKVTTVGKILGFLGYCGGDVSVTEQGIVTVTRPLGFTQGGLGLTSLNAANGEIPVWTSTGWTFGNIRGGTGLLVTTSDFGGITLGLQPIIESDTIGNAGSSPLEIPVITYDGTGRITVGSSSTFSLYNVDGGFTAYMNPVFNSYFDAGSTLFEGNFISSDISDNKIVLTNTGVTGISVNGTYYTGGIILSAGNGISVDVSGSNPETITITNLGAVGVSGNISLQGHTQGNVYLSNFTGSQNLVITKGGIGVGFDPVTGRCGYAVFVGLSSGIQLPSNIPASSNAFISIPTGFTGWGASVTGYCFGTQLVPGSTGAYRGFLEVNRIEATGFNRLNPSAWGGGHSAGYVLELYARGGTQSGKSSNSISDGRNAKIVLAAFPSDQWNLLSDINGNSVSLSGNYTNVTVPNNNNPLPGLNSATNATDIEAGTVRLYKNARVEKHMVVGGNLYVLGNYFDNTGATVDFVKIAAIATNNFIGAQGASGFRHPAGASFGSGILYLGASGISASDSGIHLRYKGGTGGSTAAFFGIDRTLNAFVGRISTTTSDFPFATTSANTGPAELNFSGSRFAPFYIGAINGITLQTHEGNVPFEGGVTFGSALINIASGHRLGLCGAFGLTFAVSSNNTVTIPAEASQLTTLVTLTNTQTITNKTLGTDCIIDCGTY